MIVAKVREIEMEQPPQRWPAMQLYVAIGKRQTGGPDRVRQCADWKISGPEIRACTLHFHTDANSALLLVQENPSVLHCALRENFFSPKKTVSAWAQNLVKRRVFIKNTFMILSYHLVVGIPFRSEFAKRKRVFAAPQWTESLNHRDTARCQAAIKQSRKRERTKTRKNCAIKSVLFRAFVLPCFRDSKMLSEKQVFTNLHYREQISKCKMQIEAIAPISPSKFTIW
jgi:hypothetical protein